MAMRIVAWVALLLLIGLVEVDPAASETYPLGPIRIIAPGPPGSPRDIRARWAADKLGHALGQVVIVDNRPGAGGNIGMEAAAKSAPDGRTLVIADIGTLAQNPHLYDRTGYNALADFVPVIRLVESPLLLAVSNELPVHSVDDLVRLARQKPGQLSFGSAGIGTPPHLAAELFNRVANIDVVHVPYKGSPPALNDLVAGRIAYVIDNIGLLLPQVTPGKIRALAITGTKRIDAAPNVPTLAEAGFPDYEYTAWMGIAVPAGTPKEIVNRLNAELSRALREPSAQSWFEAQGATIVADTPEVFAETVRFEYARWEKIIREAHIKAE
jgi:tripartite-type tricarboxylate transporter receptor subunit TctC